MTLRVKKPESSSICIYKYLTFELTKKRLPSMAFQIVVGVYIPARLPLLILDSFFSQRPVTFIRAWCFGLGHSKVTLEVKFFRLTPCQNWHFHWERRSAHHNHRPRHTPLIMFMVILYAYGLQPSKWFSNIWKKNYPTDVTKSVHILLTSLYNFSLLETAGLKLISHSLTQTSNWMKITACCQFLP